MNIEQVKRFKTLYQRRRLSVSTGEDRDSFHYRVRGSRLGSRLPTEPCVRVRTRLLMLHSYPLMKRMPVRMLFR